jgi:hypothetical protein
MSVSTSLLSCNRGRHCRFTRSLNRASRNIRTSGPFPDKNEIAPGPSACKRLSWTARRPARVLPDPGTPVTKHIVFAFEFLARSTIETRASTVPVRFTGSACACAISRTSIPAKIARAASIIVGTGRYAPVFHWLQFNLSYLAPRVSCKLLEVNGQIFSSNPSHRLHFSRVVFELSGKFASTRNDCWLDPVPKTF